MGNWYLSKDSELYSSVSQIFEKKNAEEMKNFQKAPCDNSILANFFFSCQPSLEEWLYFLISLEHSVSTWNSKVDLYAVGGQIH